MKNFNFGSSNGSYRVKPLAAENGHGPPVERKTDWRSVFLCAVFTFTASVQFTMFFTSLWPFMQMVRAWLSLSCVISIKQLDASVTVSFFGAVIAMYSLSQIVASPLLGIWSNHIERLKPPLLATCAPIFHYFPRFQSSLQYFPADRKYIVRNG